MQSDDMRLRFLSERIGDVFVLDTFDIESQEAKHQLQDEANAKSRNNRANTDLRTQ